MSGDMRKYPYYECDFSTATVEDMRGRLWAWHEYKKAMRLLKVYISSVS